MSLPIRAIVNFVTKDPDTFLGAARNVGTGGEFSKTIDSRQGTSENMRHKIQSYFS